ncbi:phosphopyruvate hydratase [Ranunculus cassubicifolius]
MIALTKFGAIFDGRCCTYIFIFLSKSISLGVVNDVNAIIGKDPTKQTEIDNFMVQQLDGTVNEWGWCKQKVINNLAGNKTLVLPVPAFNVINGGSHAGNKLAMHEFMILPVGASSFKEAMKMGVEVYHHLKSVIKKKYGQDATNVGDEGGFAPNIQVVIGMDVAASEFYDAKDKTCDLNFKEENNDGSEKISGDSLKNVYKSFVTDYPIVSIEDPFDQDDWEHYAKLTNEMGQQVQIVGDDLLVTNPKNFSLASKSCSHYFFASASCCLKSTTSNSFFAYLLIDRRYFLSLGIILILYESLLIIFFLLFLQEEIGDGTHGSSQFTGESWQ